ncbi:MAG: hypothetical protein LBP58_09900 [Azoarcus sp.]|nr:hypothetical protein [Azoarcus sp.]
MLLSAKAIARAYLKTPKYPTCIIAGRRLTLRTDSYSQATISQTALPHGEIMNICSKHIASIVILALSACASNPGEIDTSRLSLVDENHAEISKEGQTYILDSYIVLFQRPYYILVRKSSNQPLTVSEASSIAAEYIKPRGCTTPLSRRVDLDRSNPDKTQWLIGIEC